MIKEYIHPIEVLDEETGAVKFEDRVYRIESMGNDWWNLTCDGNHISKILSEEECRRVIWAYWTNLGLSMPYLEADKFKVIAE